MSEYRSGCSKKLSIKIYDKGCLDSTPKVVAGSLFASINAVEPFEDQENRHCLAFNCFITSLSRKIIVVNINGAVRRMEAGGGPTTSKCLNIDLDVVKSSVLEFTTRNVLIPRKNKWLARYLHVLMQWNHSKTNKEMVFVRI